jgi:restriction system protein
MEAKKQTAAERTEGAQQALQAVEDLLTSALGRPTALDWGELENLSPFPVARPEPPEFVPEAATFSLPKPEPPVRPAPPPKPPAPRRPMRSDPRYRVGIRGGDVLRPAAYKERQVQARAAFERDLQAWARLAEEGDPAWREAATQHAEEVRGLQAAYARELAAWQAAKSAHDRALATRHAQARRRLEEEHVARLAQWEQERAQFEADRQHSNQGVRRLRRSYEAGDPEAVEDYCRLVTRRSPYPDTFPAERQVAFDAASGALVLDCALPPVEALPALREVKYVQSRDLFAEYFLPAKELNALHERALYQMAVRSLHELFGADSQQALQSLTFNGWITTIDRATGTEVTVCAMSLTTTREAFVKVNLSAVDPKECFDSLGGQAASKLQAPTGLAPGRSTRSRRASSSAASRDLATLGREEFQRLLGEVLEKAFAPAGGEVHLAGASREAELEAMVFDPDPLRGGKVLIRVLRQDDLVGLRSLQALYAAMLDEGATRGLLLTTSGFGPDAYEFVRGKPLTLLNGKALLGLLAHYGYPARLGIPPSRPEDETLERFDTHG